MTTEERDNVMTLPLPYPFHTSEIKPKTGTGPLVQVSEIDAWQLADTVLADPNLEMRQEALIMLAGDEGTLYSPLTGLMLYHLLCDEEPALRARAVKLLARIFERRNNAWAAPEECRQNMIRLLRGITQPLLVKLLHLAATGDLKTQPLVTLLDWVPDITRHLTHLAGDREQATGIRLAAVTMIRELGLIDALPVLDSIERRLIARKSGQIGMKFAPPSTPEDQQLLAELREAITYLREDE